MSNEKERDRSGDGAGPVASHEPLSGSCRTIAALLLMSFLLSVLPARASLSINHWYPTSPRFSFTTAPQPCRLVGLSLLVDAGMMFPERAVSNFYNGNPNNANKLDRILYSESFGPYIWNNLSSAQLIGSAIGNYRQLVVAEYGDMYYRTAFRYGVGVRYDLVDHPRWAWSLCFDYSRLVATGVVLLESGRTNSAILTNQDRYVSCPVGGEEKRIFFDLGVTYKQPLNSNMDLDISLGANVNNLQVVSNDISIAGVTYSLLDVWGGETPYAGAQPYEYINQGGIGYGAFGSLGVTLTLPSQMAAKLAYSFCYTRLNLEGYERFSPHHSVLLQIAINNFSFFNI